MITQSIKEAILADRHTIPGYVYVVRDGSTVFYVGMSKDPEFRLCQHLGIADAWNTFTYSRQKFLLEMEKDASLLPSFYGMSQVGVCVIDNAPSSLAWSFDIYETQDAIDVIKIAGLDKEFPRMVGMMEISWYDQRSIVESNLIEQLEPYLNSQLNSNERDLPERYRTRKLDLNNNAVDFIHLD
jgi:hypothetical protein